jgi:hypothetical protein
MPVVDAPTARACRSERVTGRYPPRRSPVGGYDLAAVPDVVHPG